MMRFKSAVLVCAVAALFAFALPELAQDGARSEVSVDFTGNFQSQAIGLGVTDSPTYSGGFLANYRYHFNDWSAIEVNYDYTRFSQDYSAGGSITQANAQEFTLAYVNTLGVRPGARIKPFVEVGTGALIFSPVNAGSTVAGLTDGRPAFLYGAGLDYRLMRRVSLRVGYRGLLYKAPDFAVPSQTTNAFANMSEPYVGVAFRF
jgi:opacity protein-like surface antigen